MTLSQQDFEQTWKAAGENQTPNAINAAWRRYRLVSSSEHDRNPASRDTSRETLEEGIASLLQDPTISKAHASHHLLTLQANRIPWTPTSIHLKAGTTLFIFSSGRLWRSMLLDLWVGPQFGVWYRIGVDGRVFNSTAERNTFVTGTPGELYITKQLLAWFTNPIGGRVSDNLDAYHKMKGKFDLLVAIWKPGTDVASLFQKCELAADSAGARMAKQELSRMETEAERPTPPGWDYLYSDSGPCIHCKPYDNVGIIQQDLEPAIAFQPGTKVAWDWLLKSLPSRTREDLDFTHDYFSVAFEFENGRDLTYTWSRELQEEYGYWCPLPTWTDREIATNMLQKHEGEMTVKNLSITAADGEGRQII